MSREPTTIDVPASEPSQAVAEYRPQSSHPLDQDPAQFAVQVRQRGENYATLITWLADNMVPGEDMVQVHFVNKTKCNAGGAHPYGDCSPTINPGHWSDPDLSKKGAEKICGLLGLTTRFLGMDDFRRAALKGIKIQDVVADCELAGVSGAALSQGTGSCSIDEVGGSLNRAMKTAVKRAHIDAVKRIAGLSGIATELKRRMKPIDLERGQQGKPQRGAQPSTGPRAKFNTGAVLTHCPFGRHNGQPWREIPSKYLEWIVEKLGDAPDLVKAAAGELAKRRQPAGSDSTHTQPPPPSGLNSGGDPDFDDEIPF